MLEIILCGSVYDFAHTSCNIKIYFSWKTCNVLRKLSEQLHLFPLKQQLMLFTELSVDCYFSSIRDTFLCMSETFINIFPFSAMQQY